MEAEGRLTDRSADVTAGVGAEDRGRQSEAAGHRLEDETLRCPGRGGGYINPHCVKTHRTVCQDKHHVFTLKTKGKGAERVK